MKRYIFPILFSGLALACTEDDLVRYDQDKDGLHFYSGSGSVLVEDDASALQREFNFADVTYQAKKPGDLQEETYYYGDSLASFTYKNIYMQLQGFPTPDERPYQLKVVKLEDEESDFLPEVVFEPFYSVSPNSTLDTIRFTVKRPQKDGRFMRGVYRFGIVVDTEDNSFFQKGATERNVLRVTIRDVYEKPAFWDDRKEWLGEFDQEKYAFMLSYSQLPFTRNNEKMRERTEEYNQELIAYLNEHPEIAERFETPLPDMPKMVWWDANKHLLGEYSKEKFEFMQGVLDGEPLQNNDKLLYWNIRFREEAEQTAFEFPRNERQASWWDNQALGAFTPEKQETVVKCIFETCQLDNVPGDAWTYVPSILRMEADEYYESDPTFPLDENEPSWWGVRAPLFGEFSSAKRDMVVRAVFELYRQNPWMNPTVQLLMDETYPNSQFANHVDVVASYIEEHNQNHPEHELTIPDSAPFWWNEQYLGTYSKEKKEYMEYMMEEFEGGQYYYNNIQEHWATVFRCCVDWYNQKTGKTLVNDFPATNGKWYYWNNYSDVWGEYSDIKKTFVLWVLYREIPGFGDYWEYTVSKERAKTLLKKALDAYNVENDPDLPFNFD